MEKTGALIVASLNFDSRERGSEEIPVFLPMLPLDGTTVIKREIMVLRKAGISPIIVLCGYQEKVLQNHLSHNSVIFCKDENYMQNSFEETLAVGLTFAKQHCERLVVVPVECPAFSVETVERLKECADSTIPVCQDKPGRIRLCILPEKDRVSHCLPLQDKGILYELTADGGMQKVQEYVKRQRSARVLNIKTEVVISREEDFFGPELYQLLRCIEKTGSIQAAASILKISYSKSWKLINRAEQQMGFPFLKRYTGGKNGGRSDLTPEGRRFMERYHAMLQDMERLSQNFFDIYFQDYQ